MRLTFRRTIAAPPAVVFDAYTDPERLPDWQPGLRGLREQTGPLDQPGTTYVLDQPGPRLEIRVLRVEPPRLHEQLERFRWYGWVGTARFEPLPGDRTRLSYEVRVRGRPRWLWWLVVALSATLVGNAELSRLKEVAERMARAQQQPVRSAVDRER